LPDRHQEFFAGRQPPPLRTRTPRHSSPAAVAPRRWLPVLAHRPNPANVAPARTPARLQKFHRPPRPSPPFVPGQFVNVPPLPSLAESMPDPLEAICHYAAAHRADCPPDARHHAETTRHRHNIAPNPDSDNAPFAAGCDSVADRSTDTPAAPDSTATPAGRRCCRRPT